jgi:hypothetical protein
MGKDSWYNGSINMKEIKMTPDQREELETRGSESRVARHEAERRQEALERATKYESGKYPSAEEYESGLLTSSQLEEFQFLVKEDEDVVNHPSHYTSHPSGVECIQITEHMGFCIGNAIKYLWRAGLKDPDKREEDLKKALFYVQREIDREIK